LQFAVHDVTLGGPVTVNGLGTYTSSVGYAITEGQGTYSGVLTAALTSDTFGVFSASSFADLVVMRRPATVTLSASNPQTVQVSSPGGVAASVTLTATINGGSLGDISKASPVIFSLTPVVTATPISCSVVTSGGGVGGTLTATATCNNVPVNVYDVSVVIGGNYYTGTAGSLLSIFDPSLGFVTGGGSVVRNGTSAQFEFDAKYLTNGNVQGSLTYLEHRPSGDVLVQTVTVQSLSIVGTTGVIISTATVNGAGNYMLRATVVDNGEPGINNGQFGLQITSPDGSIYLSFPLTTISGGNIQIHR
jgi:hypothetical protein